MSEYVRQALLLLFKEALDKIYLINGVNSEQQRSIYTNAIAELEALAPTPDKNSDGRIAMPTMMRRDF